VAKSLYSDKEIFIRELISNANDALEKLRYVQLAAGGEQVENDKREIYITVDDINKILTIKVSRIQRNANLRYNRNNFYKFGKKEKKFRLPI
jgi:hypothetical protein